METVTDFIFLGSKITVDSNCCHEIKRCLLLGRKIMFNKSNESGYPCLVPDLRGNASSFSPLNMMLDMSLPYQAFSVLSYVPSMSTFWSFIIMDVEFYQKFFLYLLR